MKQQTGSKLRKEYIKAEYCHPAYLTSMQSTSCEMLGWMKHKMQSRLPGEISITSDVPDLEEAEAPEIKLPTSVGSLKKQENWRKTSTSASLTMLKPLIVWITTNS